MTKGFPDWGSQAGRSMGGEELVTYSFSASVGAGATATVNLPVVATGKENIYQSVVISCNDDSAIHQLNLIRVHDSWVFYTKNFITGGNFDFPGQPFYAGQTAQVQFTNNSSGTLTFRGTVNWVSRNI